MSASLFNLLAYLYLRLTRHLCGIAAAIDVVNATDAAGERRQVEVEGPVVDDAVVLIV